jgi:hypothetical protein
MPVAARDQVRRRLAYVVWKARLKREFFAVGRVRYGDHHACHLAAMHASSTVQVPRTLTSQVGSGERLALRTVVWAAR